MNPIVSNDNELKWKYEKMNELTDDGMFSDKFAFQGINWKIKVRTITENSVKYLAIYLYYENDNKSEKNWICESRRVFKTLNQNENGKDWTREDVSIYDANSHNWGYTKVLEWLKLESDGYMKDNSIIVEIELDFKYYDFSKNIPNYTDIILNVDDTKFYVNKGLLSSKSEYFYNKFVVENSDKELKIENVKAEDFRYFIASFCLFFETVKDKNYEQLINLAAEYKTPVLHRNCEKFLMSDKTIQIEKKIGYADKHGYVELMKTCIDSITTTAQIKKIRKSVEFGNLKNTNKLAIMSHLLNLV